MRASGLGPRGQAVGAFTVEGTQAKGEVTIQKGGALVDAVRQLSESVAPEPLPVQQREQVRRFQDLLLEGTAGEPEEAAGKSREAPREEPREEPREKPSQQDPREGE